MWNGPFNLLIARPSTVSTGQYGQISPDIAEASPLWRSRLDGLKRLYLFVRSAHAPCHPLLPSTRPSLCSARTPRFTARLPAHHHASGHLSCPFGVLGDWSRAVMKHAVRNAVRNAVILKLEQIRLCCDTGRRNKSEAIRRGKARDKEKSGSGGQHPSGSQSSFVNMCPPASCPATPLPPDCTLVSRPLGPLTPSAHHAPHRTTSTTTHCMMGKGVEHWNIGTRTIIKVSSSRWLYSDPGALHGYRWQTGQPYTSRLLLHSPRYFASTTPTLRP